MKKLRCLIALLLAFSMLLCFAGCTQTPPAGSDDAVPGSSVTTDSPVASEPENSSESEQETEPPPEPEFVEHSSIQSALPSPGDAPVPLTGDETVDLTGIPLLGRKEIILNGHTLTLTGAYGVTADAVLDIKPGDVADGGTLDMTGLTFDFGFLDGELPPEKALVEIRPGVTVDEPEYPEGVSIREFPDVLTVIQCD
jgi:predicted small secreted protein